MRMLKYLVVFLWAFNYVESGTIPDCGPPIVPNNAYIENEKSKYASGDRVTFKCNEGFNQEGIATTLCFMGRWNVMPFRCDTGGCGDPGTPDNGNKVGISYAHGREVFFSCNIGYVRVGSEQRRCLDNNTWSGTQPTCKLLDCGPPKKLTNGFAVGKDTTFQKTFSFQCAEGFELVGNPHIICESDGKWSTEPICRLSCGLAPTVKNADLTSTGTSFNATVVYKCRSGFTMNGDDARRCTAKGEWSGVAPNCMRVCKQPELPFGAYVKSNVKTEYNTGESITLDCKKGFKKIGTPSRFCISGRWTAFPFECKVSDCGQPKVPRNAYIENKKSKYASGDRVTFKCNEGFNQEGIATTLCFMGRWNVMPFRCDTGGCGDPGTPDNSNKVGISYAHGREVFFSCNIGYVRVGSEQRRCLDNNTWSGTQPTCELLDCGPPKKLTNGFAVGKETTFEKTFSFQCAEGFELVGNPRIICQSDGKWSTEPICRPRTRCSDPGTPRNGIKKRHSCGNLVFFACNFGYKIVGSMTRKCLPNKQWSGVQPTCKRLLKDCARPVPADNAYIPNKKSRYLHGESLTFKCRKGFLPSGIDTTHCFMGTWNAIPFSCINTKF